MKPATRVTFGPATTGDAADIASLLAATADELTSRHGSGHWSLAASEKTVLRDMRRSVILLGRTASRVVATFRLARRKPWAIDPRYFSSSNTPVYLTTMAVDPSMQGKGIGRLCIKEAKAIARDWPSDAIRLDAYDAEAGAGDFYRKCGFREVGRVSYKNTPLVYFEMMLPTPE